MPSVKLKPKRPRAPKRPVVLAEPQFFEHILKFAKQTRTEIVLLKARNGKPARIVVTSYEGTIDFEETAPGFHSPGWASWWALRLLHPVVLHDFETEIRGLFEAYKRGERQWITYNEEKRALLQDYLSRPYDPKKARRR